MGRKVRIKVGADTKGAVEAMDTILAAGGDAAKVDLLARLIRLLRESARIEAEVREMLAKLVTVRVVRAADGVLRLEAIGIDEINRAIQRALADLPGDAAQEVSAKKPRKPRKPRKRTKGAFGKIGDGKRTKAAPKGKASALPPRQHQP